MKTVPTHEIERTLLIQGLIGSRDAEEAAESLDELARLADTAGMVVVGRVTQRRERPTPAYLIGSGKIDDVREAREQMDANRIVFDNELTSVQVSNLSRALGVRVLDRTELILQIFARRARSAQAQAQVELAQLRYLLSRVPETERQQRFKGNIGMKGPGESPLQLRNVPMRRRIRDLRLRLDQIQAQQAQRRRRRRWPWVCLVGYTNAGKSTLLNVLTRSDAYVDDRLFATLDTKSRLLKLETGRCAQLIDTVGFIRNLPHTLVAAFRSTLDVAVEADLLLVVVDASHPRLADHIAVSRATLAEIGAGSVPSLLVLNKSDRTEAATALLHIAERTPGAIPVSAMTGYGMACLRESIDEGLQRCCNLWPRQ